MDNRMVRRPACAACHLDEGVSMADITLPSGRIVTLRPITWWDKAVSANANFDLLILGLACRIATIDGKPLTIEMTQEMSLLEATPIIAAVGAALVEAYGLTPKAETVQAQDGARLH